MSFTIARAQGPVNRRARPASGHDMTPAILLRIPFAFLTPPYAYRRRDRSWPALMKVSGSLLPGDQGAA
jgi:hypothetical protein